MTKHASSRRRGRRTVRVASVALSGALLVGLTPAGAQTSDGQRSSKVTVAIKASENNITPFTLTLLGLPVSHDLTNLIYDTLFWSQVKADPEPWLAESAEPSNDYRTWTVKLRPGVTWHDGRPLTADDVAFTFEKMKVTTGGRYSHHVWEYPVFERAEVLDPLTVRLNFTDRAPTFKILPGGDLPIVPKHIWEGVANPTQATDILPVGSGPYKMTSFVPDQVYRLEANANYFKGRPKVDAIDLPIVRDQSAAFAALQTGQVDSVDRVVPPELYQQMSNQPGIKVVEATRMESVHLHFNNRKAPLTDARLRNAITDAINNDAIVQTVLLGRGRPGQDGWVHPDSAWADPQARHVYDVAGANRTLDDAGFRRGEDGVRRTPDGNRIEFNLSVAANEPQHQRSAQLIAQQVDAIGVKINVESVDAATLRQRRNTGNIDSFITNLESHAHADPDALYFFFHSPAPNTPGSIFGSYSNPGFDRLVEQARSTVDNDERKQLLVEAQRIFAQDAPALVLYYPNGDYAYRTAAYDGWIADTGHGILTKRSFIPGYEGADNEPALSGTGTDDGPPWAVVGVLLGLAVVGGGVVATRTRRREEYEAEEA
ncbi:MAG TPA: ABC transporter substrate-binding protein [Acidimicrobiales bacterium]|nr:ABC transporter substrate-binding protein [Acidimicrobiales bacterium]